MDNISEKVADLKALGQAVSDFSSKHSESSVLLDLWFLDTVEDRIIDSGSELPSWKMKKSLNEILDLYYQEGVFFSLMYGYEDNAEAITEWLIKSNCMVDIDDIEEEEDSSRDLVADHEQTRMADAEMGDI
jgi:hypothetical protein